MVDTINFVREQRRRLSKQQQLDLKIFRYALIAGGISLVVMAICVGIQLFMTAQVTSITEKQNVQLSIISAQAENEKSYVTFAAKLQNLAELFTNRRNKQEAIAYFSTLFDNTVLINGISYRASESELTFGLQSQNIFSLNRAVQVMNTQEVQDRFTSLTYDELSRGENGEYNAEVVVVLKSDT